MAAASVLPFPARSVQTIPDLKTRIMRVATTALQSTVDGIMEDLEGKDFQALSETLLEKGQAITGAILSTLLNGLAATGSPSALCPQCGKPCAPHSDAGREVSTRRGIILYNFNLIDDIYAGFLAFFLEL